MERYDFTSDNTSGVHSAVMAAIQAANNDYQKSYGLDPLTEAVEEKLSQLFERDLRVFLVGTGTASNALAIAHLIDPWGSIICHETAHIAEDECGAPEFFSNGAKLLLLPGESGKITAESLERYLTLRQHGAPNNCPAQILSLSNATEFGTCYDVSEVTSIAAVAKHHGLHVHMDGARFANAIARFGCKPSELTWRGGVDVLSFGFTKNGALAAEAIIFFNPEQAKDFDYRRKRSGHLLSKHRFLATQVSAMLENNLWLKSAKHANDMADYLAKAAAANGRIRLAYPVQANEVFLHMPKETADYLWANGYQFYSWGNSESDIYRFVCSFTTTAAQVDHFISMLKQCA